VKVQRIAGLDVFRGWAILLMVMYHFAYDLKYFAYISSNLDKESFWVYRRYLIVFMFLVSMGMGLKLTYRSGIAWHKVKKRTLILGVSSLLVTVVTYIQFPHTWVYFGVLHFILVASWLGLIFLPYPRFSLATAILILLGSYFGWLHTHHLFTFFQPIFHLPVHYSQDIVRLFPWFAVVLIGMVIVSYQIHIKLFSNVLFSTSFFPNRTLAFLGRHSLIVYLVHQPILFALFMLFT